MIKFKKSYSIFIFLLIGIQIYSQNKQVLSCKSYEKIDNNVIFKCNDGAKIALKFLDSKNIKCWFSPNGDFERNNESFAVINEDFDNSITISVQDSSSAFEIFTGDLRVRVSKNPFNIQIFDKYQKLILGDLVKGGFSYEDSNIITKKVLRQDEHFFGLGEKTGSLDRRGKSYVMWNSDKPCYSEIEDPLYKSIPFFVSNYNYGIFFDNTYKTKFDFGEESNEYYSFSTPGGPFIYYFMYGKNYKEIFKSYIQLTGQPILPPKWAFGFSQSRGLLTTEKLTREIAKEYRERNIPCDIIYQDIGWVDALQNFDWHKDKYSNPKKMLSDLLTEGFKVIVSQDPIVSQSNTDQWDYANANNYFVADIRTNKSYDMPWPWGGNAGVVDFTNPKVSDWWGELQQKPIDDGIKGFWTDMGEPAWSNEESTDRLNMKHYLGNHDEIHNVYGLTWDKVVTEQFEKRNPNQRVFQMTRAAYAGMQRYTFGWSGDSGNGSNVLNGWINLENQIPLGLSAGLGLVPFWTTDISGYCGDITDYEEFSELYVRWLQFGVFNPLSRAHHEGNNAVEPWLFGDKETIIAKKAIELKYKLHPYIYTYAREAYDTGLPIMRALFLEYPSDTRTFEIDDQFLLGKELLIAPVVKEGEINKNIYLPKGNWIDFNNPSKVYEGSSYISYKTPIDIIPMFIKEGSIIPMMPVMQFIGAQKNYPLILDIYPKQNNNTSFIIYEDDGETNNYKKNVFSKTKIEYQDSKDFEKLIIHEPAISELFNTEDRNYWVQIHTSKRPKSVVLNDKKIKKNKWNKLFENRNFDFKVSGYNFDSKKGILYIKLPDNKMKQVIIINN
ncbi:glycoside hydrolase family 31 protein [uncultured Lutibacter sp.]|uniref:glycoside hydrolase family 31 protein n=1 Tax=uncultured Lutibacter sp. TaxID=437739 RepID=UPI002613A5E1|nr:glycoside hydrolase family 31 protein [uncultured Lutibacter sp.]